MMRKAQSLKLKAESLLLDIQGIESWEVAVWLYAFSFLR